MYCPYCGAESRHVGAVYCTGCGKPLGSSDAPSRELHQQESTKPMVRRWVFWVLIALLSSFVFSWLALLLGGVTSGSYRGLGFNVWLFTSILFAYMWRKLGKRWWVGFGYGAALAYMLLFTVSRGVSMLQTTSTPPPPPGFIIEPPTR